MHLRRCLLCRTVWDSDEGPACPDCGTVPPAGKPPPIRPLILQRVQRSIRRDQKRTSGFATFLACVGAIGVCVGIAAFVTGAIGNASETVTFGAMLLVAIVVLALLGLSRKKGKPLLGQPFRGCLVVVGSLMLAAIGVLILLFVACVAS
jgi:hypothetical protein